MALREAAVSHNISSCSRSRKSSPPPAGASRRRNARAVRPSVPGARPRPRSIRPGKQRLQHPEPLGHHQRRVVRQHDAARADPDRAGRGRDLADHDLGGRARHRWAGRGARRASSAVAEAVDMAGERQGVVQRLRRGRAGADEGEVEDGERCHGPDMVSTVTATSRAVASAGEPCIRRRVRYPARAPHRAPCRLSDPRPTVPPRRGTAEPDLENPEHRTPWAFLPTPSRA